MAKAKHPTGEEREVIFDMVFVRGVSIASTAETVGRDWRTVNRVVNSPQGIERLKEIEEIHRTNAKRVLTRAATKAAESWEKQLELANQGKKAQHLPAKELLTHIKALEVAAPNQDKGTQILIQIGSGHEGVTVDGAPAVDGLLVEVEDE